MKEHSCQYQSA